MFEVGIFEVAKILHIIAVISWMAGLLYLPRIYVYHAETKVGSETDKVFQIMEKKLLRFIMNPAMIITFICGIYLALQFISDSGWIHAKISLVLGLAGFHGFLSSCRKKFEKGTNIRSAKFYRIINEVPTILMIIIITLVVLKPF